MLKFNNYLSWILTVCLLGACEPGHKNGSGGHSHGDDASQTHEETNRSLKAAKRIGPNKGRVVTFAKVNWELAGGPQARLYVLDSKLKQRALKAIPAELVIETPLGQKISKFSHAKDHLVANTAYDPAKDRAMVMITIKGKTELIDFSK